jgi:D-alanyl-D-alanine carboxypeptidase
MVGVGELAGQGVDRCSGDEAYEGPSPEDVPARVWDGRLGTDIDGHLGPGLVGALEEALDSLLVHYPAASVAVAIPGEGRWSATRGIPDDASPLDGRDPPFQAASITKAFVAAVVLQLVHEGRLSLDDSVAPWLPDLPGAELITLDDLLTHTNGLVSFNALPDGRRSEPGYVPPEELVALAAEYPLQFCPGASWSYTNTGYLVLGRIVEEVEGAPLAEVVQQRIVRPLGLTSTALRSPADDRTGMPRGHTGGVPLADPPDYATPWAAGGLVSTAEDLVRFWHAFLGGSLVPEAAVRAAFRGMYPMQPLIPAPPGTRTYYGRGVQLTEAPAGDEGPGRLLEHSGGMPGFNATMAYAADDGVFVAVMANDRQVPAAAGLWVLLQVVRRHRGG